MKFATLLLSLILVPACGDDSPTAPSAALGPLTGTWTGTLSDPTNGSGTMRVVLTELSIDGSRSLVGGAWTATFADPSRNAAGDLGGIVSNDRLSLTAAPTPAVACTPVPLIPPGSFVVDATVTADRMVGTYWFSTCGGSVPGTLSLGRQ